jgi:23S rRNA pseudouridine2605 synthase
LANAGIGSRRTIERWVAEGRITIDGRVAKLGDQLKGRERVCVNGKPIRYSSGHAGVKHSFIACYKPSVTRTAEHTEDDAVTGLPRPRQGRWIDVSALDLNTSGLIVLTTDGELASRLMHPSTVIEREYAVRVLGEPAEPQVRHLLEGIQLDDGVAKIASFTGSGGARGNSWYRIVLRETRHRDLRPILAAVGLAVSRVIRIRYGVIELGKLYRGATRPLTSAESKSLYEAVGAVQRTKAAPR